MIERLSSTRIGEGRLKTKKRNRRDFFGMKALRWGIPSDELRTVVWFFFSVFVFGFLLTIIKVLWADDPFQKIVLAPLAEEAWKIAIGMFLAICVYVVCVWMDLAYRLVFYHFILIFSVLYAFMFGVSEGYVNNVIFHVSSTLLAAFLVVGFFLTKRKKNLSLRMQLLALFVALVPSIILHSIMNQYANLGVIEAYPRYACLTWLAEHFSDWFGIAKQSQFIPVLVFIIYFVFLSVCMYHVWVALRIYKTNKKRKVNN